MRGIITVAMMILCLQAGSALANDVDVVIQPSASHVIALDSLEIGADGLIFNGSVSRRHFSQRSRPFGSVVLNVVDADGAVLASTETGIEPKMISRRSASGFNFQWDAEVPAGSHFEIAFVR